MLYSSIKIVDEVILAELRTQFVEHFIYLEALKRKVYEVFSLAIIYESLKSKHDNWPHLINTLTFLTSSLAKTHPAIEITLWKLLGIIECFELVN